MHIRLFAYGSRGDVQPLIALGKGLQAAGYQVSIAAGRNFRAWVESSGLAFEPFSDDLEALTNSDLGKRWLGGSSANPTAELLRMRELVNNSAESISADLLRLAEDADVLVSGIMTLGGLDAIAGVTGKIHITAWLAPMVPTASGPAGMQSPFGRYTHPLNRLAGTFVVSALWSVFEQVTNRTRAALGLSPATRGDFRRLVNQTPSLQGFSPLVVPPPADWGSHHRMTGYWIDPLPTGWTPSPALRDFLAAGDAPVYIGFGSMSSNDPAKTVQLMVEALAKTGRRGIIHSGWAKLHAHDLPETVFLLDQAPHEWLFPQMAAVVHHGGAGTTAAALRAGVPSMIVAHIGDQPLWGRRVYELGVGVKPIRRHQLTSERLARGIDAMIFDPDIRRQAQALGQALRAEDGVARAVEQLRQMVGEPLPEAVF